MADVVRTSMFLDRDLARRAQDALGTETIVETVHEALRRTVQRNDWSKAFLELAEFDWPTNEEIEAYDAPKPPGYDPFEGVTDEELAAARASFRRRLVARGLTPPDEWPAGEQ